MSKQASLNGFVVSSRVGSPLPKKIHSQEQKPFTVIVVKLEPLSYGRCCLCNYRGPLPFCVEYLDAQAVLTCWGDICQTCGERVMGDE